MAPARRRLSRSRRSRGAIGKVCASSAFPPRERTAAQAKAAGIPLTSFGEHRQIDLTIDGADEVERGTLNLIKGLGGALAAREDRRGGEPPPRHRRRRQPSWWIGLGRNAPVPVEVVAFGLEATQESLEVLGASARLRMSSTGEPFVTDSGNRILDCDFGRIADPARLEERIRRIVGVVESGLFISRADPVFVADAAGVHRLDSARAHRGSPPILVIMGVSGSRQVDHRRRTRGAARLAVRGGRCPASGVECRQDACRNSADRCRSSRRG